MDNKAYIFGFILGLLLAAVILGIIWKLNRNMLKGVYDERQELIRGRGYKLAFMVVILMLAAYMIIDVFVPDIPAPGSLFAFFALITGVVVYAVYCMRNGAFFGVNQKYKSYRILLIVVIATNLLASVMHIYDGDLIQDGVLTLGPSVQILTTLAFAIVLVAMEIQLRVDRTEAADEES